MLSVAGIWEGTTNYTAAPAVDIDFASTQSGPFDVGTAPYVASFSAGEADGTAWTVADGITADATFGTDPHTVTLSHNTSGAGVTAEIIVRDTAGAVIGTIVPTDTAASDTVTIAGGELAIGSISVTTTGGSVMIDNLNFGYIVADFDGSIDCVVSVDSEAACTLRQSATGAALAGARGILSSASTGEMTGSGEMYSILGTTLPNGERGASMTVTSGMLVEATTLDMVFEGAGQITTVAMTYDNDYETPSSLATVSASYASAGMFGNDSSLNITATGELDGQFMAAGGALSCTMMGQVSEIDTSVNAYDITLDVTGVPDCGVRDGTYNGLGITRDLDGDGTEDTFVLRIFSEPQVSGNNRYIMSFGRGVK